MPSSIQDLACYLGENSINELVDAVSLFLSDDNDIKGLLGEYLGVVPVSQQRPECI